MKCYLAIDIGASSGRHILGYVQNNQIQLKEVYRFENGAVLRDGRLCWDIDALFGHILNGLKRCGELNMIPESIGIDTWGVDYILIGEDGAQIGEAMAYRDERTKDMPALFNNIMPYGQVYGRTGLQKQAFNTIYQLMADMQMRPEIIKKAKHLLFMPQYLSYLLSGEMHSEYTICSTSGLLDAKNKNWDDGLIDLIGVPKKLFGEIKMPGSSAGELLKSIRAKVGFNAKVILPPSHDTASAVLAAPINNQSIYISSGTWSLMGLETKAPDVSQQSLQANLSNEGGYGGTYRLLKNIMGLWMIQCLRKEEAPGEDYGLLSQWAQEESDFASIIDVNDISFFAPKNMAKAINDYCQKTGQAVPQNIKQRLACVYHSLAQSYAKTIAEIESLTGQAYSTIAIIGGGSQNHYLNKLTAEACHKKVTAGPVEATAIGNILSQMIGDGVFDSAAKGREAVRESFLIKAYGV